MPTGAVPNLCGVAASGCVGCGSGLPEHPGLGSSRPTPNSDDFSLPNGHKRQPCHDLAPLFASQGSHYGLGVDGLSGILLEHFGAEPAELFLETDFQEEPRRLVEISAAEQELFDRVWYHRTLQREYRLLNEGRVEDAEQDSRIGRAGRERIEAKYVEPGQLGPYTDFELGMLNGKLSALRWVLGADWDFLDT